MSTPDAWIASKGEIVRTRPDRTNGVPTINYPRGYDGTARRKTPKWAERISRIRVVWYRTHSRAWFRTKIHAGWLPHFLANGSHLWTADRIRHEIARHISALSHPQPSALPSPGNQQDHAE